ncbi:uncharacterized protein LOC129197417 isoform X1 [Grus americana]|uniref:uncharacterized protein LOC129197417 isoform X1 n=1 Tax=Grus americana TaxID=9117 RepID=UPI002407DFFD|nr:uncharacterized protein LOC129197417 isoform X1 [Grus americana]
MSQHIGKLCRSAVSSFLLFLLVVRCQDTPTFMTAASVHCYLTGERKFGPQIPLRRSSGLIDVGVSGGSASKENAAVTHVTAQPSLLTTPEPWHLLVTQTPAKEKAKEGETVVLNCHFSSPRHPSLTDLIVKWYKEDEKGQIDLLENNVTVLPNNSRVFMSGDISQGDASLVILNVTTSDHGIYFCEVTLPDGTVVTGDGTQLRIRRALGLFGIEESIGTIIGVVAAGIGGVLVLIIVLTPQLRRCVLCMRQGSRQV